MHKLLKSLPKEEQKKLTKKKFPLFEEPMLAQLTHDYFSDPGWIFERKFDGERCLVFKNNNQVTLKSRNNKNLTESYPEITDAFKAMNVDSIIVDGEMVAFQGTATSFSKLQARFGIDNATQARATKVKVYYYVFDILYLDGYDLTKLPLIKRKSLLKHVVLFKGNVRFTPHRNTYGEEYRKEACLKGWEGLIGKQRDGIYEHRRSGDWLKFKCVSNQELVIGGFTDPQGSRIGFGALLLGYYENDSFIYAGKVGTGFDDATLQELYKKLQAIEVAKSPFTRHEIKEKNIHWVKPQLVAEIGFTEWTTGNKLRHPRYLGLRRDKKARDVVKEQ